MPSPISSPWTRRTAQLVVACAVLGIGVGLILLARFGSDGYSSLVNGIARATGAPYAVTNWTVGFSAVAIAWLGGVRPGPATIVHPIVVGTSVNVVLDQVPTPSSASLRAIVFVLGMMVLSCGVAGYLEAGFGAGPFEAATLAVPRLPFRVSYNLLQGAGALAGWELGADLGVGTLVIVLGVGPIVALLRDRLSRFDRSPRRGPADRCRE